MKTKMRTLIILSSLISFLLVISQLTGCATAGKGTLPQGGDMTMAQIYQQETGLNYANNANDNEVSSDLNEARDQIQKRGLNRTENVNYAAYSVRSSNETNQLFKPLPNPEVPLYIFPHLVYANAQGDDAQPVPGYTTAFYLYRKNHFAMPNEVY